MCALTSWSRSSTIIIDRRLSRRMVLTSACEMWAPNNFTTLKTMACKFSPRTCGIPTMLKLFLSSFCLSSSILRVDDDEFEPISLSAESDESDVEPVERLLSPKPLKSLMLPPCSWRSSAIDSISNRSHVSLTLKIENGKRFDEILIDGWMIK